MKRSLRSHRSYRTRLHALLATACLVITALSGSLTRAAEANLPGLQHATALDIDGEVHRILKRDDEKLVALVFMTTECPLCREYVPELNRISRALPGDRVAFYGVLADPALQRTAAAEFCDEFAIEFPLLFDASAEIATALNPRRVPEAFLLDQQGNVLYRGRINDLYADVNQKRQAARTHDFREAIDAAVAGEEIAAAETEPVGCLFEYRRPTDQRHEVTFTRDIAPILFAHCAECHRPGEVAPFSLLTYEDAAKRASFLAEVTATGLMPPWQALEGHGEFLGERRLTPTAKSLFQAWAAAGAPEGDPADLPPTPQFSDGWHLGEPDLVLTAPDSVTVPADGPDIFQHWIIPIDIPEDKSLVAFEFRPGNSAVVHHAVLVMDQMGAGRAKDAETPEPGYQTFGSIGVPAGGILGVWTPGMTPRYFPDELGLTIPIKTDLIMQLHLHPSGKEESDQSSLGLYFADKPTPRRVARAPFVVGTILIDIAAGEKRHEVTSSVTLPADVELISLLPHMHLIGHEMKITATLPDGSEQSLIWIDDWNFYWQDNYVFREPVKLPAGTRLDVLSAYDNSADNPSNPSHPPERVLFGNDSNDEMCFGIFQVVAQTPADEQKLNMALLQSFMKQWTSSDIDPAIRQHIADEAAKLFGGSPEQFNQLLSPFGGSD